MAEVQSIKWEYENDSNDLLQKAKEENFETVCIVGFKNGAVMTAYSHHMSRQKLLGAIEEFKFRLLSDTYQG